MFGSFFCFFPLFPPSVPWSLLGHWFLAFPFPPPVRGHPPSSIFSNPTSSRHCRLTNTRDYSVSCFRSVICCCSPASQPRFCLRDCCGYIWRLSSHSFCSLCPPTPAIYSAPTALRSHHYDITSTLDQPALLTTVYKSSPFFRGKRKILR